MLLKGDHCARGALPGARVFRTVFLLPMVTPPSAVRQSSKPAFIISPIPDSGRLTRRHQERNQDRTRRTSASPRAELRRQVSDSVRPWRWRLSCSSSRWLHSLPPLPMMMKTRSLRRLPLPMVRLLLPCLVVQIFSCETRGTFRKIADVQSQKTSVKYLNQKFKIFEPIRRRTI